jgi:hypothetical protein
VNLLEVAQKIVFRWRAEGGKLAPRIVDALQEVRRAALDEAAKEGIACAHELKRNADEAETEQEKTQLLSEAMIAWDVVGRIRARSQSA